MFSQGQMFQFQFIYSEIWYNDIDNIGSSSPRWANEEVFSLFLKNYFYFDNDCHIHLFDK